MGPPMPPLRTWCCPRSISTHQYSSFFGRSLTTASRIRSVGSHHLHQSCSVQFSPRGAKANLHTQAYLSIGGNDAARRLYSASAAEAEGLATSGRPEAPEHLDEKEKAIFDRLSDALEPTELEVSDISGGCGSMYAVAITTEKFRGLPVIKQHRLVNQILGEDIKSWHGIQLRTKAP